MTSEPTPRSKPLLFLYALILPVVWIIFGVLGNIIAPGKRLGITGTALVVGGVTWIICSVFVRKHRRHFTPSERWRLIVYCTSWALLFEAVALAYASFTGLIDPSDTGAMVFTVCFTIIIQTLFFWLGFTLSGRRAMTAYLEKHAAAPPVLPPESPAPRDRSPESGAFGDGGRF